MDNKLTALQEQFAREYAANPSSATAAAVRAGYSETSARVQACRNLQRPHVLARIQELREPALRQAAATTERVMEELERIGLAELPAEEITVRDKLRALDLLAKIHAMYKDERDRFFLQIVQVVESLPPERLREVLESEEVVAEVLTTGGYLPALPAGDS